MFKKLMVAVDFFEGRNSFVKCLGGLVGLGAREATVAFCVDAPDLPGVQHSMESLLGGELADLCETAKASGLEVRSEILIGPPAATLTAAAERLGCSLLVVGSRRRTALGDIVTGSAAHAALCHARLPVLVLRLQEDAGGTACCTWPCRPLEGILFPTDFSDNAECALRIVKQLAGDAKARVTLLHVQDQGKWGSRLNERLEEFDRIDRARMERLVADIRQCGARDVALDLRVGHPAREIIAAGESTGASCIVMGSQGRGFFGELAVGSVSHNVARQATLPVLLVP